MIRSARQTIAALSLALAAAACSEPAAAPSTMPADVQAIIDANCVRCHSAPPQFGAPMPLGTWDAMHAPAVTDPSRRVYELVGIRIHDALRPMPPGGQLPEAELATLDEWISRGAPAGAASTSDAGASIGPPVGPEHLPCEVTHAFRAHAPGDVSRPYALDPAAGNTIMCFAFASPFSEVEQGTAFAPIIDDPRVLHHWIIFGASALPTGIAPGDAWECGTALSQDSQFLTGWAPGGTNLVLPSDIGRELPNAGGFVILQVHYWNVAGYDDVRDRSGVALCSTESPREHEIGTSTLGSLNIRIPARATGHEVSGTCTPAITEPVTIVASGPHMHTRGRTIRTEVLRGGSERDVEMLVELPSWDFNSQTGYPAPGGRLVIRPGDVLRTTCTFDNPDDAMVFFGERTEDEMCFNFVSAYPVGQLTTEAGRTRRICID